MGNDELQEVKEDIRGIKQEISSVRVDISAQGKKIDDFLQIMTEHAVLSEKLNAMKESTKIDCDKNTKDHDEIYGRLRALESSSSSSKPLNGLTVIWDVVKIIIGILVALAITGKIPKG